MNIELIVEDGTVCAVCGKPLQKKGEGKTYYTLVGFVCEDCIGKHPAEVFSALCAAKKHED